jgi:type II secretory pathway component PulJ
MNSQHRHYYRRPVRVIAGEALPQQQGLTLLELMIGLLIGIFISSSMLTMWLKLQASALGALQQSRLHQDLRAIKHVMASDIRRAGYWGWSPDSALKITQNPFMTAVNDILIDQANDAEASASCLTYSYDRNHDGLVGNSNIEQYGFRLHQQAIEMRTGGTEFNCRAGQWQDITQAGTIITHLTFIMEDKNIYPAAGCNPGAPCQRQRLLTIQLTGHLQSQPEQAITLEEQIRIRNDYVSETG